MMKYRLDLNWPGLSFKDFINRYVAVEVSEAKSTTKKTKIKNQSFMRYASY